MTPTNVTQNPARYYAWLQHVMSPDPQQRVPTGRTPEPVDQASVACDYLVSKQPAPDVEILTGRAAS